ncbi:MAG: prepilin peptidase [Thermoanaerobacteraceae bacterium]|nr:prepilin peptidase [Thermoanaerobacteraceae bacterium]
MGVLIISAFYDLKWREIPDWITIPYLFAGIGCSLSRLGVLNTIMLVLILFLTAEMLFAFNVFGGGDLKLMIGVILFQGLTFGLQVIFWSLIIFIPLALFYAVKERNSKASVPYAVAILAGAVVPYLA